MDMDAANGMLAVVKARFYLDYYTPEDFAWHWANIILSSERGTLDAISPHYSYVHPF